MLPSLLRPLVRSRVALGAAGVCAPRLAPALAALPLRAPFSLMTRGTDFLFSRDPPPAPLLRSLESMANRSPSDPNWQVVYLQGLYYAGIPREVVSRVESGRFASSWHVLELYARSLVASQMLPEGGLAPMLTSLRALWQNASRGGQVFLQPNDLRAAVQAGLSSGGGGGGGGGGSGGGGGFAFAGAMGTRQNPVIVETQQRTSLLLLLARMLPYAVLAYVGYTMLGGSKGGIPGFNPLGGPDITEEVTSIPDTRFEDVKGCDEAKGELQDVVNFLRDPARYQRLGAKVPAGVLLTGPPGTGKTLLARAVAGEAGCKFYSKSASEFEEMLVGLGARRVRDLFSAAKKNAPAIIFIDEIDALGGKRRVSMGSGNERQTLNQLLACLDGFSKNEGVIVIAATNTPDILDPALTRPGRFDSAVDVPLPDVRGRREILDLYLARCVVEEGVSSELLARATPGFSGAQLEALVNSAALMAAARGSDSIESCDVEEARDKLIMGPSKLSRVRNAAQQRLTAYHEGGHTLVSMLTPSVTAPLHKVTILPRGQSGGATFMLPNDTALRTRASILAEIDVSMGGRAAEEIVYGPELVTSGASGDMEGASRLARAYCTAFAMSELEHETLSAEECALAVRGEPIPREKLPTPASAASKSQSAQAQRAQAKSGKKRASSPAPSLVAAEH